tara:strand:- start:255 stop:839 length:585 start_codon:yes stop_codon:yes gene_type:complete
MTTKPSTTTKRDELIDVASSLFYKQGFGATGVKQIIDTAGIAKGTFYSHFKSKEEVGVAWLKKRHQVWNAWISEEVDKATTPRRKVIALFDFLEKWMVESDFRGCAFLNTLAEIPDPENPMRHEISSHKSGLRASVQELAADHFSEKPSAFAKQKGSIIFLLFEGALVEAQNFRDTWPIIEARKEVTQMISAES